MNWRKFMSKRSQLENHRHELAAELAKLEANPNYQALLEGRRIQKEVQTLRDKLFVVDYDLNLCVERKPVDPRIDAAIRWARDEKARTQKESSSRGMVETTVFGLVTESYLNTNEPKINVRLAALDGAITEFEALKLLPVEDVAAEILRIQRAVPILDVSTDKIECPSGFAAALAE